MAAQFIFRWTYLAANARVGLRIHGYNNDFVTYCITADANTIPYIGEPAPGAAAELEIGQVGLHKENFNWSTYRDVWIVSRADGTYVDLYRFRAPIE